MRAEEDVRDLQDELEDRFGDPPAPVWTALALLRLRIACRDGGVESIRTEGRDVVLKLARKVRLTPQAVQLLMAAWRGLRFTTDGVVVPLAGPDVLPQVEEMVVTLRKALEFSAAPEPVGAGAAR